MTDAPSQSQDKFIVRLPDGMRDRIKVAAEKNNRSMNAEIVATLEEAYPVSTFALDTVLAMMDDIVARYEESAPEAAERFRQGRKKMLEAYKHSLTAGQGEEVVIAMLNTLLETLQGLGVDVPQVED